MMCAAAAFNKAASMSYVNLSVTDKNRLRDVG